MSPENSAIKLSYPHPISFHYVAVKTVRRNDLEHKPKTNKNTQTANLIFSDDGVAPLDATPAMLNNGSVLEASFSHSRGDRRLMQFRLGC